VARLVSLLPSLTEILAGLGLLDDVVGITHECDYPLGIAGKTVVTTTKLGHDLSSLAIETQVLEQVQQETSLYGLDIPALIQLQPDLIFTQSLCDVCAVSETLVHQVARQLTPEPRVVSVGPTNLAEVLSSFLTVGHATGRIDEAEALVAQAQRRMAYIQAITQALPRPRLFGLEWIEPPFVSGHWFPELVTLAGGQPWGVPGTPSVRVRWEEIVEFAPDVVVILPCGFPIERTLQEVHLLEANPLWGELPAVEHNRVWVADGNSYFNRPGPRLVDSLEILAEILHPEHFQGLAPPAARPVNLKRC